MSRNSRHAGHGNLEIGQQQEFGTRINELRQLICTYLAISGDLREDTVRLLIALLGRAISEDFLLLWGFYVLSASQILRYYLRTL